MEPKNRLMIAIAVIFLIAAAMFTSFGRSLFTLNTPSVVLPSLDAELGAGSSSSSDEDPGQYQTVAVTPQTVQNVIATLTRSDSYYRELTVETFWEGGSSSLAVQVWTDGGWTHSRQVLPSGAVRHDLVGEDTLYYWYDGSQQYKTAPADSLSPDLVQRLPTYETVLDLDPDTITAAGYELRGDVACVYVEVRLEDPEQVERYWVNVDSGLLVSAETEQAGELVYRMSAYSPITSPCPASASFALPDGRELHALS